MGKNLDYHQKTRGILRRGPPPINQKRIDKLEERLGSLPESVKQWYSIHDAVNLLKRYSNGDTPIPLNKLSTESVDGQAVVFFQIENQAVCQWGFVINETEDPPVVTKWLEGDSAQCCEKFSTFIYCQMFDYFNFNEDTSAILTSESFSDSQLAALRRELDEEPETLHYSRSPTYRFSRGDRRITISRDPCYVYWLVSSCDKKDLDLFLEELPR